MLFALAPQQVFFRNRFANGAQCATQGATCQMDSRSNLLRSWDAPLTIGTTSFDTNHTIQYDLAGRQYQDTAFTCNGGGYAASYITSTRTYDAENHITAQTLPANYEPNAVNCANWVGGNGTYQSATNNAYTWGPDSQLAQWSQSVTGNATTNVTLGWDGDDLLYQFGSGSIGIYIEKLGILVGTSTNASPNYFSIYDRDWSASVAMTHESNGYTAVKSMPSFQTCAGVPTYHQGCSNSQAHAMVEAPHIRQISHQLD